MGFILNKLCFSPKVSPPTFLCNMAMPEKKVLRCWKGKKYIFTNNCTCQKYKAAFLNFLFTKHSQWQLLENTGRKKKKKAGGWWWGRNAFTCFQIIKPEYKQDKKFLKRLPWWCLLWIVPYLNKRKASHWKKKHLYHSKRSQGSPFKMRYFLNKAAECSPAGNEHLIS